MEHRIQVLNVEIKNLRDQVIKVNNLLSQENFAYNILESQFGQLKARNAQLAEENLKMETKIRDSVTASDKIIEQARQQEQAIKAEIMVKYHKAEVKMREIQDAFSKAEKKQIETHLKELETMGA
jgi:cell division protein FtsB